MYFRSKEEALEQVKKGNIHQILYFSNNFSDAVTLVRDPFSEKSDEELEMREIQIYRDSVGESNFDALRAGDG